MNQKCLKFRNTFLKLEELPLKLLRYTLAPYGIAQDIMPNKVGMRRVTARWVPRLLLPDRMGVRVKMCRECCKLYKDEGHAFLNRAVTYDETCIHFLEPESKKQSSILKHPSSPSPQKR